MLFYLFISILIVLIIVGIKTDELSEMSETVGGIFIVFTFILVIAAVLSFNEGTVIGEHKTAIKIYSLRQKDEISGSFFLGSGSINSSEYYKFFKDRKGGLIKSSVLSSKTIIYEDENNTPYLLNKFKIRKRIYSGKIFPKRRVEIFTNSNPYEYELHVPENTIISKDSFKVE